MTYSNGLKTNQWQLNTGNKKQALEKNADVYREAKKIVEGCAGLMSLDQDYADFDNCSLIQNDKSLQQKTGDSDGTNADFPIGVWNEPENQDLEQSSSYIESVLSNKNKLFADHDDLGSQLLGTDQLSRNFLFLEDSLLIELDMQLTEDEKSLVEKFYEEMEKVEKENDQEREKSIHDPNINFTKDALKRVKCLVDKYLERGIRLNSYDSERGETLTNFIFEEIKGIVDSIVNVWTVTHGNTLWGTYMDREGDCEEDEILKDKNLEIIANIIRDVLLRGGKVKRSLFYYDRLSYVTCEIDKDLIVRCDDILDELQAIAYESIVNKGKQRPKELEVEMDNGCFYIKYIKNSIVKPAKITNNQEIKDPKLRVCILHIGKSIVRVESVEGKRNYTDVSDGSIEMSFTTEQLC